MGMFSRRERPTYAPWMNDTEVVSSRAGVWQGADLGHLCFPPKMYAVGDGPGSRWTCYCGVRWRAEGLLVVEPYPQNVGRNDAFLQPKQWRWDTGTKTSAYWCRLTLAEEQELYDWRPMGELVQPLIAEAVERLYSR